MTDSDSEKEKIITPNPASVVTDLKEEQTQTSEKPKVHKEPKTISPSNKKPVSAFSLPRLSDLSSVKEEIKSEEENKLENRQEVTITNIQKYWQSFIDKTENKSLAEMLKRAVISLDDHNIQVKVGSPLAQSQIEQSKEIMEYIRSKMLVDELSMEVTIEESLSDKTEKEVKSILPQEILESMIDKEPLLDKLITTLDLKLKR